MNLPLTSSRLVLEVCRAQINPIASMATKSILQPLCQIGGGGACEAIGAEKRLLFGCFSALNDGARLRRFAGTA